MDRLPRPPDHVAANASPRGIWRFSMKSSEPSDFRGFRPEAFQFLVDLAMNNDRSWFQPRKGAYERLLKEPLEALCRALDAEFTAGSIPLSADATRSPFRIYRDVRFSN